MTLREAEIEIERLLIKANNSDEDGSEREARAYSRVLALLATVRRGEP
jgi:hypothetical protein